MPLKLFVRTNGSSLLSLLRLVSSQRLAAACEVLVLVVLCFCWRCRPKRDSVARSVSQLSRDVKAGRVSAEVRRSRLTARLTPLTSGLRPACGLPRDACRIVIFNRGETLGPSNMHQLNRLDCLFQRVSAKCGGDGSGLYGYCYWGFYSGGPVRPGCESRELLQVAGRLRVSKWTSR